jgi:hypothetical protein
MVKYCTHFHAQVAPGELKVTSAMVCIYIYVYERDRERTIPNPNMNKH